MDLTLQFKHRPRRGPALEADLAVSSGTLGLSGPSGIGKTTLLRIIAGVEPVASGHIVADGITWQDSSQGIFLPPHERAIGWVPQDPLLFPQLSVRENLTFSPRVGAGPSFDQVVESLALTPLLPRRPRKLSGGERQRVAIGRALLSAPRLLLLDEPFSALDQAARTHVSNNVRRLCQEHRIAYLLVTHDSRDLERLADVQLLLSEGRLTLATYDSSGS